MDIKSIWNNIRNNEDFSGIKRGSIKDLLTGKFLMKDFISRQYGLIILIAVLFFIYTDNRYYCEKQQAKVVALQSELKDTKYEALTIAAQLMEMSRQSKVLTELEKRGIDLQESKEPAIRIE